MGLSSFQTAFQGNDFYSISINEMHGCSFGMEIIQYLINDEIVKDNIV